MSRLPKNTVSMYIIAFATFLAFMGIGVVDPILPVIAKQIGAKHWEIEMLFTAYIFTMAFIMVPAGLAANRFGEKPVMTTGLLLVSVTSMLCAFSNSIPELSLFRAGWGFSNALFFATAMTITIAFAPSTSVAIGLFEAAVGLGMAAGPLLGGVLGDISWRYPFAATSVLAFAAFLCVLFLIRQPQSTTKHTHGLQDLTALFRNTAFMKAAVAAMLYYFGFFTILAYSPLLLHLSALELGFVFFAWGLMLALGSAKLSHYLEQKAPLVQLIWQGLVVFAFIVLGIYLIDNKTVQLALIIISGLACGVNNSLFTTYVMDISPYPRNITSSAYNFVRWLGAGIAPVAAGLMAEELSPTFPYLAAFLLLILGILITLRKAPEPEEAMDNL
ncbi:MFS transporter [Sporomusa aerivorans]|uniref:MFS transporter n=1 Tax=Sporomusa aerivorans TaxID=204936 RepID=UPI00352BAC8F